MFIRRRFICYQVNRKQICTTYFLILFISFLVFLIFQNHFAFSQSRIVKHYTHRIDTIDISDENYILRDKEGFTAYLPQNNKPEGGIVFFLGKRVESNKNLEELAIIPLATKKNLAVIFISSGNYLDFYFDERDLEKIDSTLHECLKKHKIPPAKLMFAGYSLAGTRAIKFAIHCEQNKSRFGIHPKALVLCDSPLDMLRFWDENNRAILNSYDSLSKKTGEVMTQYLQVGLGGSPVNKKQKYIDYSPFCYSVSDSGNAKVLTKIAVRAYHEPDIDWWIRNKRKDYYSMNSIDIAGLINQLKLSGNKNAELITYANRKKELAKNQIPGTWSIVDVKELVEWYYKIINEPKKR